MAGESQRSIRIKFSEAQLKEHQSLRARAPNLTEQ
jgi:hypothetical protein